MVVNIAKIENMNYKRKIDFESKELLFILSGILAVALYGALRNHGTESDGPSPEQVGTKSAVELLRAQREELSDWQMLILAIALTESRCNPEAVGRDGDRGVLQLTPIFVREADRLTGREWTAEDAYDIGASLEMFESVQRAHNPGRDFDEAVRLHNPGAGESYRRKVRENFELVRAYEQVRRALN